MKRSVPRFYADENLAVDLVQILRDHGYDILTSYEAGQANQGIPDRDVLIFAAKQNRILITFNRDDFVELHLSGIAHGGIIICKDDRDYAGQARALHEYLEGQTVELRDRLIRVQKQNQSKSVTQLFVIREYVR